jgi:CspA family cold shock protein
MTTTKKTGRIKYWNHARGFGFIKPDDYSEDVFLHVSKVPKASVFDMNPTVIIKYEIGPARDGKQQAVAVEVVPAS